MGVISAPLLILVYFVVEKNNSFLTCSMSVPENNNEQRWTRPTEVITPRL